MNFIKVTDSEDITFFHYINVHNINSINKSKNCTKIYAGGDTAYEVAETTEQLFQMMAEVLEEERVLIHEGLHINKRDITIVKKR